MIALETGWDDEETFNLVFDKVLKIYNLKHNIIWHYKKVSLRYKVASVYFSLLDFLNSSELGITIDHLI